MPYMQFLYSIYLLLEFFELRILEIKINVLLGECVIFPEKSGIWMPIVFLPGESQGQRAWWAAIYGIAQSWTQLKQLSSSSSSILSSIEAALIYISRPY